MKSYEIACLIPAYNEAENIETVIKRVRKLKIIDHIVVVDDGSKDNTSSLAKTSNATVLRHKTNRGKGEALKTGFEYILKKPKVKYTVVIDADLQYYPEDSKLLLRPLIDGKADFVMGYRNWSEVPLLRRLGNFLWRLSFNLLFRTSLKDTNCGFVALSRHAIKNIRKIYGGYIIDNAMLIECLKNEIKIAQVRVRIIYGKKSEIIKDIRMLIGNLIFIIKEGIKYRIYDGNGS